MEADKTRATSYEDHKHFLPFFELKSSCFWAGVLYQYKYNSQTTCPHLFGLVLVKVPLQQTNASRIRTKPNPSLRCNSCRICSAARLVAAYFAGSACYQNVHLEPLLLFIHLVQLLTI